jgi:hypothetical protein
MAYHGDGLQVEDDPEDDAEGDGVSHPAGVKMPSRKTFSRAWYQAWSKVLRLKFPSEHSCCQTCFELREKFTGHGLLWKRSCNGLAYGVVICETNTWIGSCIGTFALCRGVSIRRSW